jgi:UDP-3-O-[3-hydroxymyristoyl] N-acetylglucosamine deacetylase
VYQKTIKNPNKFSGIGLHSGKRINVKLKPSAPNSGIVFVVNGEILKTSALLVTETTLCTGLNNGKTSINTIEHFLFALYYLSIDNIIVEIDNFEMPILDGSAAPFLYILRESGIKTQKVLKKFMILNKEISVKIDDKYIIAKPSYEQIINIGIEFEHPMIKSQSFEVNKKNNEILESISRARTFGFMEEVEYLRTHNLALGGSINNAIILDKYKIMNQEGLRMPEEFIYHKILDFLGDTYIEGTNILANIKGFKTGHHINNLFMRELLSDSENYSYITFEENNKENNVFIPKPILNF